MKSGRVFLCRSIPLALLGQYMDQYGTLDSLGLFDDFDQAFHVVSVHRSQIRHPHVFKKHTGDHQLFKAALCSTKAIYNTVSARLTLKGIIDSFLQIEIAGCRTDIIQIFGHATYIFGDGHIVIIEDNDKIGLQLCSIIQCFVCHASGKGSVTDHRYNGRLLPFEISGFYQSQSCRYGSRAVSGIKCIITAFFSFGEPTHAMKLA